jgi:hypothetical protein
MGLLLSSLVLPAQAATASTHSEDVPSANPPEIISHSPLVSAETRARVQAAISQLPLYFVENRDQMDTQIAYYWEDNGEQGSL